MYSLSPFDAEIAAELNSVPLPAGLLDRLRAIPLASDADLDAALIEVTVPPGLTRRLSHISAGKQQRWPAYVKQAAAAVLMFALGLSYALSVVAFVVARFDQRARAAEPLRSAVATIDQAEPVLEQTSFEISSDESGQAAATTEQRVLSMADTVSPMRVDVAEELAMLDGPIALAGFASYPTNLLPNVSIEPLDTLSIERAAVQLATGRFDVAFWRQTGLLPWLDVAAAPTLEVPPGIDDGSYRYARREIRSGRLPSAAAVRVEEFLAGIDYGFSAHETYGPSVVAVAAPSPFGGTFPPSPPRPLSPSPPAGESLTPPDRSHRWLVMIGVATQEDSADARLLVRFSSDHVKALRLIGYGPPPSGGTDGSWLNDMENATGPSQLMAGRSIAVLAEIELAAPDEKPLAVGYVRVLWHDKQGERRSTAETAIGPDSFFDDFDAAPVAWRQAALAALTAENLAESPFADQISLSDIAALARQLEPLVTDRRGWREFIEVVLRAQSLRTSLLRAY